MQSGEQTAEVNVAGNLDPNGGPGDGSAADIELEPDLEDPEIEEADDAEDDADDGGEGGGEGDAGDGQGQNEAQGQARQVSQGRAHSRRAGRSERLEAENRQLRARQTDFERQLAELSAQRNQPSAAEIAEQQRREDEAYELMSPAEQRRYTELKLQRVFDHRLNQAIGGIAQQNDKQQFQATLRDEPKFRRFESRVEELYATYRGAVSRDDLLTYAIGDAARKNVGRAVGRANRAAEAANGRQSARPSNGRSDVAANRGRQGARGFEHLRDVPI